MPARNDRPQATETLRRLTNALTRPDLTAPEAALLRRRLLALLDDLRHDAYPSGFVTSEQALAG